MVGTVGRFVVVLVASVAVLMGAVAVSFAVGSVPIPLSTVWAALTTESTEEQHLIVRELRGPRTLGGLVAGACLAVAGGLLQGATRNPLASPTLMGITAGAAFGVVSGLVFLGVPTVHLVWAALIGGMLAAALAMWLASTGRDGLSPIRLALSGAIVSLLLSSWTTAVLATNENTADAVRYWLAGSLAGREVTSLRALLPLIVGAIVLTVWVARPLNTLSLGDQVAAGLGYHPGRLRGMSCAAAVAFAAVAVALAGPIAFVGLAIPHLARALVGNDIPRVLAVSVVLGPALLLGADVVGRIVARPAEVEAGVLTALVGAPVLVAVALTKRVSS